MKPKAPTPAEPDSGHHLAVRIDDENPNHHLWDNHGTWWIHLTIHEGNQAHRVRRSLRTRDLAEARQRRDRIFASLARQEESKNAGKEAA